MNFIRLTLILTTSIMPGVYAMEKVLKDKDVKTNTEAGSKNQAEAPAMHQQTAQETTGAATAACPGSNTVAPANTTSLTAAAINENDPWKADLSINAVALDWDHPLAQARMAAAQAADENKKKREASCWSSNAIGSISSPEMEVISDPAKYIVQTRSKSILVKRDLYKVIQRGNEATIIPRDKIAGLILMILAK